MFILLRNYLYDILISNSLPQLTISISTFIETSTGGIQKISSAFLL